MHIMSAMTPEMRERLNAAKRRIFRIVNSKTVTQDVWDRAGRYTAEINALQESDADSEGEEMLTSLNEAINDGCFENDNGDERTKPDPGWR